MKKSILIFSIVSAMLLFLAACNTKTQVDPNAGKVMTYTDTLGLADFQKWKAQNELRDPSVYYKQGIASARTPVKKSVVHRRTAGSLNSVGQYPAKPALKRGWSRKAKGAVIGGGSGAIIGALVNKKNRLVGGALGGVLGAGLGYVVGNELDRKHGR
jgi:YMGG-like Gly-zipper